MGIQAHIALKHIFNKWFKLTGTKVIPYMDGVVQRYGVTVNQPDSSPKVFTPEKLKLLFLYSCSFLSSLVPSDVTLRQTV